MLKKEVLRGKKNFSLVYNKGKSIGGRYIVIFFRKNNLPYSRFAYLASKKVGNSVQRSRAVRLMRESYRLGDYKLNDSYDIIFVARNTILNVKCQDVKKTMEKSLFKIGVIEKNELHK